LLPSASRAAIDDISWQLGSQQQTCRNSVWLANDGTDRQTDAPQFHGPRSAYYVSSVKNNTELSVCNKFIQTSNCLNVGFLVQHFKRVCIELMEKKFLPYLVTAI